MFIVEGRIISTEVFTRKFICNLNSCKGACCWEGDFGAPVTEQEIQTIKEIQAVILPLLSEESRQIIQKIGVVCGDPEYHGMLTPLHTDGACVYLVKNELGIAQCAFEKAWSAGKTSFKKPLSCHLYPIRVTKNAQTDFEALNYDEWDICSAACAKGAEEKMPVFRFVKDAIVREYGQEFYNQMEDIYKTYFT